MAQWWERSPPTNVAWIRFRPGVVRELGFSGFSVFFLSTKTNVSKFQFDYDRGPSCEPAKADIKLNNVIYFYHFVVVFIIIAYGLDLFLSVSTRKNLYSQAGLI